MTYVDKPWRSTWEIHPGEFAIDHCEDRNIPRTLLPTLLGCPREHIESFLNGETPVTHDLAPQLGKVLGFDSEFWLGLQQDYEDSIARNAARERAGINTTVYKMVDDDGRPVKYGMSTDLADTWDEEERAGNGTELEPLTWFLRPEVAQRKLDKLQRAFRNRKQRQAAAAAANAQAA